MPRPIGKKAKRAMQDAFDKHYIRQELAEERAAGNHYVTKAVKYDNKKGVNSAYSFDRRVDDVAKKVRGSSKITRSERRTVNSLKHKRDPEVLHTVQKNVRQIGSPRKIAKVKDSMVLGPKRRAKARKLA